MILPEIFLLFVSLSAISIPGNAQKKVPDDFCITSEEKKLFDDINALLTDYNKKALKLSASLSYVARLHVDDLLKNRPDTSICNLSSWSDKGAWTACCYNKYVADQECMWGKPKELTTYPYRGYELAGYFQDEFTADSVIELWSSQKEVLDMILARENYSKKEWVCMGVGMNGHYVSVWFGQRPDKVKPPPVCDTSEIVLTTSKKTKKKSTVSYYLIIASFTNERDAREAIKRFKKNGFNNVGYLKTNGKVRIYLDRYSNIKEAMYAKQNLPYTYRDAWIYKE
ncbi:MAG: SPOR domain-containing protein [Chlorobi bacterium]|nr:SPOR domain-containing protein [Chlorobiota bacterium]